LGGAEVSACAGAAGRLDLEGRVGGQGVCGYCLRRHRLNYGLKLGSGYDCDGDREAGLCDLARWRESRCDDAL
jgi:hypothetical protein